MAKKLTLETINFGAMGVSVALFEADGGAWQIAAKYNIRTWLEKQSTGLQIIG